MSLSDPERGPAHTSTGPARGVGLERDPRAATMLVARIAIVITVIFGQLWAITAALDAWYADRMSVVWWLVAFQGLSFLVALVVGSNLLRRRR